MKGCGAGSVTWHISFFVFLGDSVMSWLSAKYSFLYFGCSSPFFDTWHWNGLRTKWDLSTWTTMAWLLPRTSTRLELSCFSTLVRCQPNTSDLSSGFVFAFACLSCYCSFQNQITGWLNKRKLFQRIVQQWKDGTPTYSTHAHTHTHTHTRCICTQTYMYNV